MSRIYWDFTLELRAMAVHDRIEINPRIMLGKPVIKGSRITVELILRKIADGADDDALLEAYPVSPGTTFTLPCVMPPTRWLTKKSCWRLAATDAPQGKPLASPFSIFQRFFRHRASFAPA